jgi:hypothetical protein
VVVSTLSFPPSAQWRRNASRSGLMPLLRMNAINTSTLLADPISAAT